MKPALYLACLFIFFFFSITSSLNAQNAIPQINDLQITVEESSQTLQLNYNLSDTENDLSTVSLQVSTDNQLSFQNITQGMSGDIGTDISPGNGKQITWAYDNYFTTNGTYQIRLVADDNQLIDIAELVAQVDSNRLRQDLEAIVGVRHATAGPAKLAETKDSIRSILGQQGLHLREQSWMRGNYEAHNIIGQHHGITMPDQQYIVDAHYDSVDDAPGADDNGSGTVGMLEVARILSQYSTNKTIEFIGFDLEEAGLVGSARYVSNNGRIPGNTVQGVLNFEMIGYYSTEVNSQEFPTGFSFLYPDAYNTVAADSFRGNFITNVGDNQSMTLMNAYADAIQQYVPDLKEISISANAPGSYVPDLLRSDHASFWFQNIPALMITDGANFRNIHYHTPEDKIDKLNFTFMRRVVQAAVATIAELAEVRHADVASSTFELSGIVSTKELDNCDFSFYPQPSNTDLFIDLSNCSINWTAVELRNIQGQKMLSKETSSNQQIVHINTQALSVGVYFLVLKNEAQELIRKVSILR